MCLAIIMLFCTTNAGILPHETILQFNGRYFQQSGFAISERTLFWKSHESDFTRSVKPKKYKICTPKLNSV